MSSPSNARESSIGLLIVHGIGDQRAGETTAKVISGFKLAFGEERVSVFDEASVSHRTAQNPESATTAPRALSLRVSGFERVIRLYEVYWADILSGRAAVAAFDVEALCALKWIPQLNRDLGLYTDRPPKVSGILTSKLGFSVIGACIYFVYYGARQLVFLSMMVLHWVLAVAFLSAVLPTTVFRALTKVPVVKVFAAPAFLRWEQFWLRLLQFDNRLHARAQAQKELGYSNFLDNKLDLYLGDIFAYVQSLGGVFTELTDERREAARSILARFHQRMGEAIRDCGEVHVLAHSLGTVIAYHGLTGYGLDPVDTHSAISQRPMERLRALYTIGSPLNKFRYFWPILVDGLAPGTLVHQNGVWKQDRLDPAECKFQWHNFWNPLDAVAGRLECIDGWPRVKNHRVWEGGLATSHVIYEQNIHFLRALTEGVFGKSAHLGRSYLSRAYGAFRGFAESVTATGLLVLIIGIGLLSGALTALVIAWLIGAAVTWAWGPVIGGEVRMWVFLGMLAVMVLSSLRLGKRRAHEIMTTWWLVYCARRATQGKPVALSP